MEAFALHAIKVTRFFHDPFFLGGQLGEAAPSSLGSGRRAVRPHPPRSVPVGEPTGAGDGSPSSLGSAGALLPAPGIAYSVVPSPPRCFMVQWKSTALVLFGAMFGMVYGLACSSGTGGSVAHAGADTGDDDAPPPSGGTTYRAVFTLEMKEDELKLCVTSALFESIDGRDGEDAADDTYSTTCCPAGFTQVGGSAPLASGVVCLQD